MKSLLSDVRSSSTAARLRNGAGVELSDVGTSQADQDLTLFLAAASEVQKDLARLKTLQNDITSLHDKSKTLIKSRDVAQARTDMQEKISLTTRLAHEVKSKIETLDKDNLAVQRSGGQAEVTTHSRTRTTVVAGLRDGLTQQMGAFSRLRTQIHEENKSLVEKRMYTVTGQHMNEKEIEAMIESGNAEEIFKQAMLPELRIRSHAQDTLIELQERNKAMKEVERSLVELHELFIELAMHVDQQGEVLNDIEKNIQHTVVHVDHGVGQIVQAKEYQKKSRKWLTWGILIIIVILIIIIVAGIRPWRFAYNN